MTNTYYKMILLLVIECELVKQEEDQHLIAVKEKLLITKLKSQLQTFAISLSDSSAILRNSDCCCLSTAGKQSRNLV